MPTRIVSPERRWRAAASPVLARLAGWLAADSVRVHLAVTEAGLEDHRLCRTTRIGREQVAGFEISRPGGV